MIDDLLQNLTSAIPRTWEKLILTVVLVALALLLSHLWARYLAKGKIATEKRRLHLVWMRNLIWFVAALTIVIVWASTITGFALSLAAVAGAMLLVSKELIMCVHGYFYATLVQPFKVGDTIEFNQVHGRVIDFDMLATTMVELDVAGRPTGKLVEFPNGLLLTLPLKNHSATGEFALHFIRIPLPDGLRQRANLQALEQAALTAAAAATAPWQTQIEAHFRKLSDLDFIDYSSGKNKAYWDFSDPARLVLIVRVACPTPERLQVEQMVFKDAWAALQALQDN